MEGRAVLMGVLGAGVVLAVASASAEDLESWRPPYYKKWRKNPKMVVFGDSISDAGRRFNAPASFDFEDIGPFPWVGLFEDPESDSMFDAYFPAPGSVTNGKAWPSWLRVPDELNYATSSATASDAFRPRESCTGYTGEGEEFPTATLSEQVDRYFHEVLDHTDETLDYTHVILIGANELGALSSAVSRYDAGGAGYVDPVAFENVFEVVDGIRTITFAPMMRELLAAWQDGIDRLIKRGVTGRILLANLVPSNMIFGEDDSTSEFGDTPSEIFIEGRDELESIADAIPQVRILDVFNLITAVVTQPEIFTSLGFTGSESSLTDPCLTYNFAVDSQAEIMGTQAGRTEGCQEECALCADLSSPCQNCYVGNPSATVCEHPETYLFWDSIHPTTDMHQLLAEAIRQCSKDYPKYDRPLVELLCSGHA